MSQDGAQGRYEGRSVGGGRYQLRDLLGAGGMASVHLAYDTVLDRQVAIKTLHTELGREQSFRERFRREAQSVAKLSHTNIVSVFDSGEDAMSDSASGGGDGAVVPYIVMEYVEGQPLRSVLDADVAQYGAMPAEKALKITADVLAALEVSHEMGLVHRDIKPGNVMMTKRNVVKVMDFGIARAMQSGVTSMTQTGMVVGTPQYLSPEQALGRGVDARSDLYSVGIMLFELLTGRLPFDADSPLAIAYAHVQEEPPPPSSINRSVPPAVDALVSRALRKNPNERFPTAEAMRDECARAAGSGQTGAAPIIIAGGPAARSGSGVGSAVFPPVDQQTPAPPNVHTPYQQPAQQPHSGQQMGGFGPSTPPPPSQPMQQPGQPGYHTPGTPGLQTPAPSPYGSGSQTPPPYSITPPPHGPSSGGRSNMPVIVASVVVALLAIGGLITAIVLNKENGDGGQADGRETTQPTTDETASRQPAGSGGSTSGGGEFNPGDKTRVIDTEKCTEANEYWDDNSKISAPQFQYYDVTSVKECLNAAGWKYSVVYENENSWGKGIVLRQTPLTGDPFDPKDKTEKFVLTVSTGKPA
ncbi:protein kinase domain-containing protein [Streptomyces sp. 8N616]|uniref:protein kinase domain-containing protein n=1 Tax=Streptomyces sp. 8N616 TaxID=3457414 RepID=UPI003FD27F3A